MLHIGDLLLRPKCLGISHVGVWLGGGAVFHNLPGRGEHVSSVAEFAGGEPVSVEPTHANSSVVWSRVHQRLSAPRAYDVISNNCEHSASHVVTGKAFSRQLLAAVAIIGIVVAVCLVARKR